MTNGCGSGMENLSHSKFAVRFLCRDERHEIGYRDNGPLQGSDFVTDGRVEQGPVGTLRTCRSSTMP